MRLPGKENANSMAQGQSYKIMTLIKCIRNIGLSMHNSLSAAQSWSDTRSVRFRTSVFLGIQVLIADVAMYKKVTPGILHGVISRESSGYDSRQIHA